MQRHLTLLEQTTGVQPEQYATEPMFMSWDAVGRLACAGMEVGAHTRTHPMLSRIDDPAVLRDEIAGSRRDLAIRLGAQPRAFAYPFGSVDAMTPEADEEIRRAGFEISFSYVPRFFPRRASIRYRLPRLACEHGDCHTAFRLAMAKVAMIGADNRDGRDGTWNTMEVCRA